MKVALAGDTMPGRKVAERLAVAAPTALFSDEVVAVAHEADLFVLDLECAISARAPWPDPAKPFFFRAPPVAADVLRHLAVSCVSLANNHALDFGADALLDTFGHLADAGISWVGAGIDEGCFAVLAGPNGRSPRGVRGTGTSSMTTCALSRARGRRRSRWRWPSPVAGATVTQPRVIHSGTMHDNQCDPDETAVEEAIVAALDGTVAYDIEAAGLTLTNQGGRGLTLRAQE